MGIEQDTPIPIQGCGAAHSTPMRRELAEERVCFGKTARNNRFADYRWTQGRLRAREIVAGARQRGNIAWKTAINQLWNFNRRRSCRRLARVSGDPVQPMLVMRVS